MVDSIQRLVKLYCDNQVVVQFVKNMNFSSRNKHIGVKYLLVLDKVEQGLIEVPHLPTQLMIADPLTKGISPGLFKEHVSSMGVLESLDSI